MSRLVVWMIHCYQTCLSPLLGSNCRFAPSCSCYAAEAITKHGVIKGSFIGLRRICRCHPFNPGGYDPVP